MKNDKYRLLDKLAEDITERMRLIKSRRRSKENMIEHATLYWVVDIAIYLIKSREEHYEWTKIPVRDTAHLDTLINKV